MTILVDRTDGDSLLVSAPGGEPGGACSIRMWTVWPGESLFGYSYEELRGGWMFDIDDARSRRFGSEVVPAADGAARRPHRSARLR